MRTQLLSISAVLLFAVSARGVTLQFAPTNSEGNLTGTSLAADPTLAGTVLDTQSSAFSATAPNGLVFHAVLNSTVVRESGSGTLDFYYQVTNVGDTAFQLYNSQFVGFTDPAIDVDYRTDLGGQMHPTFAFRGNPGTNFVGIYGYTGDWILPNLSSSTIFIRTSEKNYASGGVAMIGLGLDNGNLTNDAPFQFPGTFLPAGGSSGNLPEPTTLGLLGVAALAQWLRSR